MGILITLAIQAGLYLLAKLMAPDPKKGAGDRTQIGDITIPRAKEGMPIPLIWGRNRMKAPTLVWAGAFSSTPLQRTSGGPIEGYSYAVTMQFVLGIPGAKGSGSSGPITRLRGFWIGDRLVRGFDLNGANMESAFIDKPDFFGGDFLGGGVRGTLAFYGGTETQEYIADDFKDVFEEEMSIWGGADYSAMLPRYRGQAMVTLTNFRIGESVSVEPYSFDIQADVPTLALGTQLFRIGDDANPVAVLVDLLTSKWGRLGLDLTSIDTTNFLAVGQTLEEEGHGFSYILYDPTKASEVIQEILTQCDMFLYPEPTTGDLTLKLVREDYVIGDLPLFNPSNVVGDPAYSVTQRAELYNMVRVTYTDRAKAYSERTATAMNQADIALKGGKVRALERYFPGVHDSEQADRIAARLLRAHSLPLAKLRIGVNRDGFELRPGACFRFTWPDYNLTDVVFRVGGFDLGTLEDGRIMVDAVQDVFAVGHVAYEQPTWETLPILEASPIVDRVVTEAPRFIQHRGLVAGIINDETIQRGFYVAAPEGDDVAYKVQTTINDETTYLDDGGQRQFHGRALVESSYSRSLEPYDTSTGLRITDLAGTTLIAATSTQIANTGRNLILVGDELMAFESSIDEGGGIYTLENVWRGLLDTPAVEHAAGERVYFVGTAHLGSRGLELADEVAARIIPRAALAQLDTALAEVDTFTVRERVLLPYPGADLQLDASKGPGPIVEGGPDVTWKTRTRLTNTIIRGDAADETIEATATFDVVGRKEGDDYTDLVTGITTPASATDLMLGAVGHGSIEVGLRSERGSYAGWAIPSLDIFAYRWRNQLRNSRFASNLTHWTTTASPVQGSTAGNALGGGGGYIVGVGGIKYSATQIVDVSGYQPERLTAVLDFYAHNINANATDSCTASLIELDASDNVLTTTTYGPTAQSTTLWTHHTLEVATLDPDCAKLKVYFNNDADTIVTEVILRVGQVSDQLLTEPNFASGTILPWTEVSGTWQVLTTTKYVDTYYVRPNDGASAELADTVAIPAGYEYGTVVLECGRMNDAASDTGAVIVEALNASNVVVATATTGAEALSPTDVWQRRRVVLELPDAATQIRVRLVATRVTGTPLNSCFDDFDVRIHKGLDADWTRTIELDEPTALVLPQTRAAWSAAFPTITVPDYGFWAGDSVGGIAGPEPDMEGMQFDLDTATEIIEGAKFVGAWDGTTMVTDALLFPVDGTTNGVQTSGNVRYANFTSAQAFTASATLKTDVVAAAVICERLDATGWSLDIDGTGHARARLVGSTTKTLTSTAVIADGGIHQVVMVHDVANSLLRLIVDGVATSTSTAGLGEIECVGVFRFVIGEDLEGQIARLYLHRSALAVADIQSMWTHAADPTGDLTYAADAGIAAIVGVDDDGVVVARYGANQFVMGYDAGLDTATETGFGAVRIPDTTNLALADFSAVTGAATSSTGDTAGVEGDYRTRRLTSDNSDRAQMIDITVTSADVQVVWFARANVAHTARISIADSANVEKDSATYAVTTLWQRFSVNFESWDGATATCRIRWHASDDGTSRTIDLSGPYFIGQDGYIPVAYPALAGTAGNSMVLDEALELQFSHEGEVVIEGICEESAPVDVCLVAVTNGTDDDDIRELAISASAEPELDHGNSTGTIVTSTGTVATWDTAWTIRGRWNRAGLLDASAVFAGVVNGSDLGADADYGRTATWTASAVALDHIVLGGPTSANGTLNGLIRRVTLTARESRLPPA